MASRWSCGMKNARALHNNFVPQWRNIRARMELNKLFDSVQVRTISNHYTSEAWKFKNNQISAYQIPTRVNTFSSLLVFSIEFLCDLLFHLQRKFIILVHSKVKSCCSQLQYLCRTYCSQRLNFDSFVNATWSDFFNIFGTTFCTLVPLISQWYLMSNFSWSCSYVKKLLCVHAETPQTLIKWS